MPVAIVCFALAPNASATCQDACLTNFNTVQGNDALISLTGGIENTAVGFNALFSDTTGSLNTAIGAIALFSLTTGTANTAVGFDALFSDTTGHSNTAVGSQALLANTTADENTAVGYLALAYNTTGSFNTAIGLAALANNTAGSGNIALGLSAGSHLTTGSNNIDIGNFGVPGEAKTIRIGTGGGQINTYIAGINGVTVAGGVGVIIDSTGHLGTVTSSAQYKHQIKPMDKASEAILALKPVTFRYKDELDPDGVPQFGLVAEQVEKVNPDLVARDGQGKPYTVRYEAVNAMLLNEFLKEYGKVQKLEATVSQQRKDFQAAIAELKEQIQKVSTKLELSKPEPKTVVENR
jgi:hypothetical protein